MEIINKILWSLTFISIIISGIYFSIKLKGEQFKISKMIRALKKKGNTNISSFDSLMMSTAAKVGVGSLAGVALAIYKGGIGVIFWIWITSIISAPNAFVEGILGTIYKEKINNENVGGPAYYIKKGLKNRKLAITYAILVTIVYVICFTTIQANTISTSISNSFNIKKIIVGILLAYIVLIIIWRNTKSLFNLVSKIVPIMGIGYIIIGLIIAIREWNMVPVFFSSIIKEALNLRSSSIGIFTSLIIGIQRGIFSNEAGIGTGAIASASVDDSITPLTQGRSQVLGVYFISLIIGTITAFIISTSPYQKIVLNDPNGIELTHLAFKYHLGNVGEIVLIMAIITFALSTIIAGFYYGKSNLIFIFKKIPPLQETIYKIFITVLMIIGSITSSSIIWNLSDIFIAILAIINIYAILSLRKDVIKT